VKHYCIVHCKDVSVHDVDMILNRENISSMMEKWTAYVRTEFIIFRNKTDLAVVELKKGLGRELFGRLEGFTILSLPEDTIFIEDPTLDVINIPALARLQKQHPSKTVVVKGMFSHINFVRNMEPKVLRVIDDIPPSPSKLGVLTKMALDSGFVEIPIVLEEVEIELAKMVTDVKTEAVMFPCRVSELAAEMPVYFLDEAPKIEHDVTLIGCNLSERIFSFLYGRSVPFINICPEDHIIDDGVKTIIKCCKIKDGHIIEGNVVKVPWGATVPEIVAAINDLFSE